jgi:molybdopterin synthase sulfur carrier subunit
MGMMEIRLHATLRQTARTRAVVLETRRGATVGDALRALVASHPALGPSIFDDRGALVGHVAVVVDGRDIRHLNGVDTPLGAAEHLDVFPPVGGG